jgi:hypothetical protein
MISVAPFHFRGGFLSSIEAIEAQQPADNANGSLAEVSNQFVGISDAKGHQQIAGKRTTRVRTARPKTTGRARTAQFLCPTPHDHATQLHHQPPDRFPAE